MAIVGYNGKPLKFGSEILDIYKPKTPTNLDNYSIEPGMIEASWYYPEFDTDHPIYFQIKKDDTILKYINDKYSSTQYIDSTGVAGWFEIKAYDAYSGLFSLEVSAYLSPM